MRCPPSPCADTVSDIKTSTEINSVTDSVTLTVSLNCLCAAGERANKNSECAGCWRSGEEGHGDGHGGIEGARAAEQREGQGLEA
jgi:hypothetical protein